MQRSGFHASSRFVAEQMTRVVSYPFYMMIGRIARTASNIIKYVLLISEIGSWVYVYICILLHVNFSVRYQMYIDICHFFIFVLQT